MNYFFFLLIQDESTKLTFLNVVDIPCSVVMSKNTPTLAANEITQPQVTTTLESLSLFSKPPHKETQPMLLNSGNCCLFLCQVLNSYKYYCMLKCSQIIICFIAEMVVIFCGKGILKMGIIHWR